MEYKAHRDKTKEEKLKAKWDKKGQPRMAEKQDLDAAVKQRLEQGALDFGDSLQSRQDLELVHYMRTDDVHLLFNICGMELAHRGVMMASEPEKPKSGLVDANGRAI